MTNINKNNLKLLDSFFTIEYEKHLINPNNYFTLQKQNKITHCKERILLYINNIETGTFIIQDEELSKSIIIHKQTTSLFESNLYIITISQSSETYKIDEVFLNGNTNNKVIQFFDKIKI